MQAIGAQASNPGPQVVSLSGDGEFTMLMGDFLSLKQLGLPVKAVVHDDAAWIRTPAKRASAAISAIISMSLVSSVGVVCSRRQIARSMRGAAHLKKATLALHAAKGV
jgi:hypothetical protein